TQEVIINGRSEINIAMESDVLEMDEVVVVAYGVTKKSSFTGSASTVTAEKLETVPLPSFDKALQGNVAGLQLTSSSGQPGAATQIRIRGIGSINASTSPLYVIDGVPVVSGDFSRNTRTANSLAGLNPNDIASVTVLKDAAASSLYGSRAANGVILITTKQGKKGQTQISARVQHGVTWKAQDPYRSLTGDEFNMMMKEGYINAGYSKKKVESYVDKKYPLGVNTDWTDELYRTGITQNAEVSANGGSENTKFYVSGTYFDQKGAVLGSDMNRVSGRLNLNHSMNEKISLGVNVNFSVVDQNTPPAGADYTNPVLAADILPGTIPVKNKDGEYNYDFKTIGGFNPVGISKSDVKNLQQQRAINSGYFQWKIIDNLSFKSTFGYDNLVLQEFLWQNPNHGPAAQPGIEGEGIKINTKNEQITSSNTLSYSKTFLDSHTIDVLAGFEVEKKSYSTGFGKGLIYPSDKVTELSNSAKPGGVGGYTIVEKLASYLSQIKYNYMGRYYASFSFRRDGSSKFGANNRFANFWSVGGTWRISEESFLKSVDVLNNLKLRASYGTNGNSGISNYLALDLYKFGANYNGRPGSRHVQFANPDLTWEQNTLLDVALEFRIFDCLSGTIDYYNRKTTDLLLSVPISSTTGHSSFMQNIGEMENKGLEIELSSENIKTSDFKWFTDFNISFNRNEVLKLNNHEPIVGGFKIHKEGEDFSSFYMREWAGVDTKTGDPLWYAPDGSKTSDYAKANEKIMGSASPDFYGGLTNTISYKGIDFSFKFSYQYGNKVYDKWAFITESDGTYSNFNQSSKMLDRWQKPGDVTDVPRYIVGNSSNSSLMSSRYLHDASYLRLKSLTLGYNFPKSLLSKAKIASARIYAQAYNLWTLTNYEGHDPEAAVNGLMDYDLPNVTTVTFGLELKF
ncbi:MAG: TonB-dependent receptor, partial [Bacteroidales bacterium]|nr:TonB-dependent receptor [Bacteroidales bacterium]